MLVRSFLERTARRLPEKIAVICDGERYDYASIDCRANQLARVFLDYGLKRGDRVVIHLPNGIDAIIAIFAALKAGAVFVPLNATAKPDKLAYILDDCQASILVTEFRERLSQGPASLKLLVDCSRINGVESQAIGTGVLTMAQVLATPQTSATPEINSPKDLACLIYTSGSTGRPKGVMCEHSNVTFASGSIIQYLENTESDIVLNALPLSFDYGLYQLLMTFRFGGTLVLEKSFAYPAVVLKRIEQERVTGLPGVPTFFNLLLQQDLAAFDLSSLRYLTNTAAALAPSRVLELLRKFPHARLYSMYGLTETKRTLYLPPEQLERRPASVGVPIPGTEAWLEDETGRRVPAGEVGELVIRGPHVMRGYWQSPEATVQRFRPGPRPGERLCYSGDLFRRDEEGFFYFVGRKDDIIKSRGEKVAPKEVENVLYSLPGIAEAAVVGVPDPLLGQAIKAYIVCNGTPLAAARIIAHCREHLEDFMVPRQIEFRDSLPKNVSGKIDKLALSEEPATSLAPGDLSVAASLTSPTVATQSSCAASRAS